MQQQKTVYSHHPQTGEYLGPALADRSPLDEDEVWLIPAFSTEQEPPTATGRQVSVFLEGGWALRADWRAVPLWSKRTAQAVAPRIGDTPDSLDATLLAPPAYAVWKDEAWSVDRDAERAAQLAATLRLQQQKLSAAYQARRPLEDAAELGIASTAEQNSLADWKRYCVALARVPQLPAWPVLSEADWPKTPV
ncbi:tail fiber assembly protein [Chromobacterium vaccinii]|uniref:tail fiber assembly protein n=1 Tax=Chromobacterium vaccinii TaxID=1108595 RepID=UPI003C76B320